MKMNFLRFTLPLSLLLLLSCGAPLASYNPQIDPVDFTEEITNPYFKLTVGKKWIYEGKTEDGLERIEIEALNETNLIQGITVRVMRDRVWLDGELIEDTRDYLAQDKEENVWYFGEDVDNYQGGKIRDHNGAWIAGVDGAKPGIWMPGNPQKGVEYRQEYYAGKAEDIGKIISVRETVTSPAGTFDDCIQTYDWTPLDPDSREHKYYCTEVGGLALEVDLETGDKIFLIQTK